MHRYLLHNGEIREASEKLVSPGQVGLMNGWGVFSTVRAADGVLFAWPRHWARMTKDAAALRVPMPESSRWLESTLLRLLEANRAYNATLRVVVIRNRGGMWEGPGIGRDFDVVAFTADLNNWGESVKLCVQPHGRHAASGFSGAKISSWSLNLNYYESAHERGFDEVILLNERGEVSECTSANIFAVFGNRAVTPPLASGCLPGITRAILLEDIRVPGIELAEGTLMPQDLEKADELFITSTTRDVLPVSAVDGLAIGGGREIASKLGSAFRNYIHEYAAARKSVPA